MGVRERVYVSMCMRSRPGVRDKGSGMQGVYIDIFVCARDMIEKTRWHVTNSIILDTLKKNTFLHGLYLGIEP